MFPSSDSVVYQFDFRCYTRPLQPPLQTSHGSWHTRQGILVRLISENQQRGWGEIAPLPWFGSESLEQVLDFCHQLPTTLDATHIFSVPSGLSACQFGLESAWEAVQGLEVSRVKGSFRPDLANSLPLCGLLPPGESALVAWQGLWQQGYQTLKWKIGVAPIPEEISILQRLVMALPPVTKLRLDANGGLSLSEAAQWLQVCDSLGVEFLEQPLPGDQLDQMLTLTSRFQTPIALDESVATLRQLQDCYDRGWRGIFVIKPAIAGSPRRLRQFCRQHCLRTVFSSVMETAIGRQAGLRLAAELSSPDYAVGFGISHWFTEDGFNRPAATFEELWNRL